MHDKPTPWLLSVTLALAAALPACGDFEGDPEDRFERLDVNVCAPGRTGLFSDIIDSEYFPLPVGRQLVLEGEEDGTEVRVEITSLDETEDIAGVRTRVVEEREFEDGELVEVSRNFYVQAPSGTVCYYGEDVDDYEDGEVVGHEGAWRAGDGFNRPGIIMPGVPRRRTRFIQERAPGIAQDESAVISVSGTLTVPANTYNDVVHIVDWNPLANQTLEDGEDKYYAPGVGLISDAGMVLLSITDL